MLLLLLFYNYQQQRIEATIGATTKYYSMYAYTYVCVYVCTYNNNTIITTSTRSSQKSVILYNKGTSRRARDNKKKEICFIGIGRVLNTLLLNQEHN